MKGKKNSLVLMTFCSFVLAACSFGTSIRDIGNLDTRSKLEVSTDRAKGFYKVGDDISISLKTDRDFYVTLFRVSPDNKVQQLFPNSAQKDNLVRAGIAVKVLSDDAGQKLKATEPPGENILKAVGTFQKKQLIPEALLKENGLIMDITKDEEDTTEIINDIVNYIDKKDWVAGSASYRVRPLQEPTPKPQKPYDHPHI